MTEPDNSNQIICSARDITRSHYDFFATFTTEGGPPELCGVTGICPALSIVPIAQADKCCSESIPVARAYITAQQIHIKAINKLCPIMYKHKLAI